MPRRCRDDAATMPPVEEKRIYKKYLVEFMSFRDQGQYDLATEFTQEQLAAIKPADIKSWMCRCVRRSTVIRTRDRRTIQVWDDRRCWSTTKKHSRSTWCTHCNSTDANVHLPSPMPPTRVSWKVGRLGVLRVEL